MPASRPVILLLRQLAEPDPFVAAFEALNVEARCLPVLRFAFENEAVLREHLAHPGGYAGLVLTSPRAVEALREGNLAAWEAKPAFTVGPATAAAARSLGLQAEGGESGHAEALAGSITERTFDRPLLFVCGDRRREVLPERMRAAGVPFEECVAYRTVLLPSALNVLAADPPDWVAFFSPSGVEAALQAAGFPWNGCALAAIGPATAAALDAAHHPPDAVASAPTPDALAAAVRRHLAHA
ncbi:MAG: uroporphyrinogen-III synthase [Bacteroidota bacterium]